MGTAASSSDERRAHFTFIWAIENSLSLGQGTVLFSPVFTVKSMEMTRWKLRPDVFISNVFLLLYRDGDDDGPENIEIDYELSFLAADGSPLITRAGYQTFLKGHHSGLQTFATKDEIFSLRKAEFLPKDVLTLRCRMWNKKAETPRPDICFARSRLGVDRHCFIWAIKKFSSLQPEQVTTQMLKSSSVECPELTLIFCLRQHDDKKYICIDINNGDALRIPSMTGEISLLDAEGAVVHSEKICKFIFKGQTKLCRNFFDAQILLCDKTVLLPNDSVFLRCEIEILYDSVWSRIENCTELESAANIDVKTNHGEDPVKTAVVNCPFKQNCRKFFEDEAFSDVTLRGDGKTFNVHKIILSSRSPVFKAMFTNDMREKASSSIDVPDVDADTLRRLLLYIYTNEVPEVQWDKAADLFKTADKYELLDLKQKCSAILKSSISKTNVCCILSLADMFHDEELYKAILYFISKNLEIFKSETWKLFKKEKSELAMETMERIVYSIANTDQ